MSSTVKIKNANGKTLSVTNNDGNTADIDVSYYTTVADLTAATGVDGSLAILTDVDRGGSFIYDSTATDNGGTQFGKWVRQYDGAVNVKWFGFVGSFANPTSTELQYVFTNFTNIEIDKGVYYLGQKINIGTSTTLKANGANFIATADTILFELSSVTNTNIYDLRVNGADITTTCLFNILNSQFINIYNMNLSNCDIGINAGDASDTINSEINFFGITTYQCVTPIQTQGANTQLFLNSCILVGYDRVAEYGKTAKVIINKGGAIHVVNGTTQAPASTTGVCVYFEPTSYLSAPQNANKYGKVVMVNVGLETAGAIALSDDSTFTGIVGGGLVLDSCSTYCTNLVMPLIELDTGFLDLLSVTSCRFTGAGGARTQDNILVHNDSLPINTDEASWSYTSVYKDYIDGITGGVLMFEKDNIVLNASVLNNLAVGNNVLWSTVWDAYASGDRHQGDFDGTVYTVPAGGYSNVLIVGNLEVTENVVGNVLTVEMHINVDGSIVHKEFSTTAYGGVLNIGITASLRDVAAGSLIKLNITPRGAGVTAVSGKSYLKIIASV